MAHLGLVAPASLSRAQGRGHTAAIGSRAPVRRVHTAFSTSMIEGKRHQHLVDGALKTIYGGEECLLTPLPTDSLGRIDFVVTIRGIYERPAETTQMRAREARLYNDL